MYLCLLSVETVDQTKNAAERRLNEVREEFMCRVWNVSDGVHLVLRHAAETCPLVQ